MKLVKAIELLEMDIADPGSVAIEDVNQAEKLLIEAGKRLQLRRVVHPIRNRELLPGETEG